MYKHSKNMSLPSWFFPRAVTLLHLYIYIKILYIYIFIYLFSYVFIDLFILYIYIVLSIYLFVYLRDAALAPVVSSMKIGKDWLGHEDLCLLEIPWAGLQCARHAEEVYGGSPPFYCFGGPGCQDGTYGFRWNLLRLPHNSPLAAAICPVSRPVFGCR